MLASFPASMLNQTRADSGIPNRFCPKSSRSSDQDDHNKGDDILGRSVNFWIYGPHLQKMHFIGCFLVLSCDRNFVVARRLRHCKFPRRAARKGL